MEFWLFVSMLSVLWKTSSCVLCYTCLPEDTIYDPKKLPCKYFDGSDKYVENCNKSTMCVKKVTTLSLRSGMSSISVQRGCASQSLGQEQIKVNGKWHRETVIHDNIYEEDCVEDRNDLEKATKTLICHCRGNYCNRTTANVLNVKTVFVILLIYIYHFS